MCPAGRPVWRLEKGIVDIDRCNVGYPALCHGICQQLQTVAFTASCRGKAGIAGAFENQIGIG